MQNHGTLIQFLNDLSTPILISPTISGLECSFLAIASKWGECIFPGSLTFPFGVSALFC